MINCFKLFSYQIIRLTKLFGWPNYSVDRIIRLTKLFGWPNYSVDQIIRLTKLFGWPNYSVDQIIRLTKLFGWPNYSVPNRIPNNDIWLQTEYQLFAKYYLVQPNINYSVATLIYTNLPKVFVQAQISFHIFSHLSIYQIKYTLNEVSTKWLL